MREILFRGKRLDNGEWVYGYPVGWQNEGGDISIVDSRFGACIDESGNLMMLEAPFVTKVAPSTVGQYTGLTDKNGKKIFEGDIISVEFEEDSSPECGMPPKWYENYIVAFDEVHHCWGTKISDTEDGDWLYEYDDGCATIIGNIHDKEATE